jgi:diguanylate cyclase (GGDEF)-like protein
MSLFFLKTLCLARLNHMTQKINSDKTAANSIKNKDEIDTLALHLDEIALKLTSAEEKLARRWSQEPREFGSLTATPEESANREKLTKLANYDSLTSLPNRIFFNEMLNKTLNHARRHHKQLAILFIDLDHFKHINDALGHKAGNKVLKEIADRFNAVLRSGDIIARLGGDEFVILLNEITHPKLASLIANKILQVASKDIFINDQHFSLTASIGICIFPDNGSSLEVLQQHADLALYKAKCAGGGVYQYYFNDMTLEANKHIQIDKALRKALLNEEFVLHYQPKYKLDTNTIIGVEALVRWINPDIGIVNPANFIPQMEEIGLIMPLGEWVLREACRANKSWQDQGYEPIAMAVNLSPLQFSHKNLVKTIQNILDETGMDPLLLELEITETSIMEDIELTIEQLNAIKKMGIKICIDDFGTGYTSVNFLKKFPIDILKIDQSFIKNIPHNQNDAAITATMIALAHNLNIEVVAEGVETLEQLQFLIQYHCTVVQGYYFNRPLPEAKMVLQLKKASS